MSDLARTRTSVGAELARSERLGSAAAAPAGGAHWLRPAPALAAFVAVAAIVGYRTWRLAVVAGQPHAPGWGLADFRDAIYFPVVAFLAGHNPYAASFTSQYPVGNGFPLYLPLTFLVHLPFGLLPFGAAETAYFITTLALMLVLAYFTLRLCGLAVSVASVVGLASLILISAPGQWNAFLGQCTAQVAVGMYAALYFARRRPWLAAIGVAAASFKPSSGVPFALLLLARGDFVPAIGGAALSGVLVAATTGVLLYNVGGVTPLLTALSESVASFDADPIVSPATSPYRIDVAGVAGRLLGHPLGSAGDLVLFAAVLAITALAIRRLRRRTDDGAERLSASLICLAVLACTYHQTYDLVLLALPLTAAATALREGRGGAVSLLYWVALGAMVLVAANYLVDGWTMNKLRPSQGWWLIITSVDGLALLAVLLAYLGLALRARPEPAVS